MIVLCRELLRATTINYLDDDHPDDLQNMQPTEVAGRQDQTLQAEDNDSIIELDDTDVITVQPTPKQHSIVFPLPPPDEQDVDSEPIVMQDAFSGTAPSDTNLSNTGVTDLRGEATPSRPRPTRQHRQPVRLQYDTLGEPALYALLAQAGRGLAALGQRLGREGRM